MKISKKLEYIQEKHFPEWLKTRQEVRNEMSDKQSMFCLCGRLATGLHENGCRKFQNKVTRETIKRLSHLLKDTSDCAVCGGKNGEHRKVAGKTYKGKNCPKK